jgi:hypothetical protein
MVPECISVACDVQDDFYFNVIPALNNRSGAVSFQSVNYPGRYVCVGCGNTDTLRPYIASPFGAPAYASDASWLVYNDTAGTVSFCNYGYFRNSCVDSRLRIRSGTVTVCSRHVDAA